MFYQTVSPVKEFFRIEYPKLREYLKQNRLPWQEARKTDIGIDLVKIFALYFCEPVIIILPFIIRLLSVSFLFHVF